MTLQERAQQVVADIWEQAKFMPAGSKVIENVVLKHLLAADKEERERCAKIADEEASFNGGPNAAENIANAIRARQTDAAS